jgi:hypothetical protein
MKLSKESFINNFLKLFESADEIGLWVYDESSKSNLLPVKTEIKFGPELVEFSVNKFAAINAQNLRKRLTDGLLNDFETGGNIHRCFTPRHLIKAIGEYGVGEIAICFECSLFFAQINNEQFGDSFPDKEHSQSKKIFDEIIEKSGIDVR